MARIECPPCSYTPVSEMLELLTKIANGEEVSKADALDAVQSWQAGLATPEQIALVPTSDELEVDDHGAGISEPGDGSGFFIQTWTWVDTR